MMPAHCRSHDIQMPTLLDWHRALKEACLPAGLLLPVCTGQSFITGHGWASAAEE